MGDDWGHIYKMYLKFKMLILIFKKMFKTFEENPRKCILQCKILNIFVVFQNFINMHGLVLGNLGLGCRTQVLYIVPCEHYVGTCRVRTSVPSVLMFRMAPTAWCAALKACWEMETLWSGSTLTGWVSANPVNRTAPRGESLKWPCVRSSWNQAHLNIRSFSVSAGVPVPDCLDVSGKLLSHFLLPVNQLVLTEQVVAVG